jgi:hypothetical protein
MKHYLNNIEISPRNREEIGVISDFTGSPDILTLTTDTIILPREANDIIKQHIASVGLFEGLPYKVELEGNITIDYYVDLMSDIKVRLHEVEIKLIRRLGIDNFKSRADGTSFELMLSKGVNFTTHNVPYFIIKDNQIETAITLFISIYIMTKELIQAIKDTADSIAELIEASTPIPGVSPAGPTLSYNVGAIVKASLKATAQIIYTGAVLLAVINLASQMFVLLFPPKRNLLGCNFMEIMQKSCAYLGYTFQSDLLTAQPYWNILPVPLIKDRKGIFDIRPEALTSPFNKGVPSSSDTTPTLGLFIDALLTMFNARLIVNNGVVRIERRDWLYNQTANNIMPALSIQADRDDEFSYNIGEVWKRYYIHYQIDSTDLHTMDAEMYDFHDAEFSTEPNFTISNPDLVTIKGLNDVNIPFALGRRKEKLNWVEAIAYGFFVLVDTITGIFGGGTNLAPQIGQRKNCLQISQEYFTTTKVIYGKFGQYLSGAIVQQPDYTNSISALALWNQYHSINAIDQNDWIIKENVRVRLNGQDFVSLLNNNYADINGEMSEILKIEWIDEKSFAQITYQTRNNWAQNKVSTIIINP